MKSNLVLRVAVLSCLELLSRIYNSFISKISFFVRSTVKNYHKKLQYINGFSQSQFEQLYTKATCK